MTKPIKKLLSSYGETMGMGDENFKEHHSMILFEDGTLDVFGSNSYDQLQISKWSSLYSSSDKVSLIDIACGNSHSLCLTNTGDIIGCGNARDGRLGIPKSGKEVSKPTKIPSFLSDSEDLVIRIFCFSNESFALTKKGLVYGWGKNFKNELALSHSSSVSSPTLISFPLHDNEVIVQLCPFFALSSTGRIFHWSSQKKIHALSLPFPSDSSERVVSIASGLLHCLALTNKHSVLSFGSNPYGQLGCSSSSSLSKFSVISFSLSSSSEFVVQIDASSHFSLALTNLGRVFSWGTPSFSSVSLKVPTLLPSFSPPLSSSSSLLHLSCGDYHSLFSSNLHHVYVYGSNSDRQLLNCSNDPIDPPSLLDKYS